MYAQVTDPSQSPQPGVQTPGTEQPQSGQTITSIPMPHGSGALRAIEILLVIAIIVVGGAYIYFTFFNAPKATTTTVVTSTVSQRNSSGVYALSECGAISSPGKYVMISDLKYFGRQGSCISITASNVGLDCSGHSITGSGPFDSIAPYTYAIYVSNSSNITVHGCVVSNFSYGVAGMSSSKLTLYDNNMQSDYMSNIYLSGTVGSDIRSNRLGKSLSADGSLLLANGSEHNIIENNSILFNQLFAVNVSANNNTFINNTMNSTPQYSFYCGVYDSFPSLGRASGNVCSNNNGCGFVSCKGENIPANLSKIVLSDKVNTCGSINAPGTYALSHNLYMSSFINITDSMTVNKTIPCINIASDNVTLNCNGYGIYNSTYALRADNVSNLTVSGCKFGGASKSAITLLSNYNATLHNISVTGSLFGILINSSFASNLSDIRLSNNTYGLMLYNSKTNIVSNANVFNNTYGVYTESGSIGNSFYNITARGNSNLDIYSSPGTSSRQDNLMQGSSCYKTNSNWASCTLYITANASYTPITACTAINTPGNYSVVHQILSASPDCIRISASNVTLNCNDYKITGNMQSVGYAIGVFNASNVMVSHCSMARFGQGVYAINASGLKLESVDVNTSTSGFLIYNTIHATVTGSAAAFASDYAFLLSHVKNSTVTGDSASSGFGTDVGIQLSNSTGNKVFNNTLQQGAYGIMITGASLNNTVSNNTASLSAKYDFACYGNGAVGDESGGINYGTTKLGCRWLAAIEKNSPEPACSSSQSPKIYDLLSDYTYGYGSVCFTIYGNDTTINCNGHTILSTSGGTFAYFKGSSGSFLENCYLVGFGSAVEANASDVTVLNNTIVDAQGSAEPALNITGGKRGSTVSLNNITAKAVAVLLSGAPFSTVSHNIVQDAALAYSIINSAGVALVSNRASASTYNGIALNSSADGTFQNNNLTSSGTGLICTGVSATAGGYIDLGGNSCKIQSGCAWLSKSATSCG